MTEKRNSTKEGESDPKKKGRVVGAYWAAVAAVRAWRKTERGRGKGGRGRKEERRRRRRGSRGKQRIKKRREEDGYEKAGVAPGGNKEARRGGWGSEVHAIKKMESMKNQSPWQVPSVSRMLSLGEKRKSVGG